MALHERHEGYIDRETGEAVPCQTFVGSLPARDYGYLLFVPSQRTEYLVYVAKLLLPRANILEFFDFINKNSFFKCTKMCIFAENS